MRFAGTDLVVLDDLPDLNPGKFDKESALSGVLLPLVGNLSERPALRRNIGRLADHVQRLVARSAFLVRLAVLIRNQCRCVIKYHLAESPDVNETGEVWLREWLAQRCSTFVDVGANVGDWLGQIVDERGAGAFSALAYEPSASAYQHLVERFGSDVRITLTEAAVGDEPGQVRFFEEYDAGKGSSIVAGFNRGPGFMRSVPILRLDDEIENIGWERVDALKIDAEGYDMRVLRGARGLLENQRIGVIQFEYNRAWQLAGDTLYSAMSLLKSCGYETYVLKKDGLYTLNYTLYEEYFEYSNFVALSPAFGDVKAKTYRGVI